MNILVRTLFFFFFPPAHFCYLSCGAICFLIYSGLLVLSVLLEHLAQGRCRVLPRREKLMVIFFFFFLKGKVPDVLDN